MNSSLCYDSRQHCKPGTMKRNYEKHGEKRITKEYRAWFQIKQRCVNRDNKSFKDYGGRGITMCEKWMNSYKTFLADMGRAPSPKHSIDRRDNNLGYDKDNCRWATAKEQTRNRRNAVWIDYEGERITPFDLSKKLNINYRTLMYRIRGRDIKTKNETNTSKRI